MAETQALEAAAPSSPGEGVPLYLELAGRIAALIESGALRRGDRLSSVRDASARDGVSPSTIVQAYHHLEDRRLIEARPRSGYFVTGRRPAGVRPELPEPSTPPDRPAVVELHWASERVHLAACDPTLVSFGTACAGPALLGGDRLRRALSRATLRHRDSLCRYPYGNGAAALRAAVARRALGMGCELDPQRILLTNGTFEAIGLCLRAVTEPGDTVAIESPTAFGFLQILESLHLRALEIPTHPRTGLSLPALELALDTQPVRAVLAVPTLSNPLGAIMPAADRRRLARMMAERDLPLIEDAIFNDLCERNEGRRTVKSYDRDGVVMLCSSFSKTVSPGMRTGWLEAGRWSARVQHFKHVLSGGHTEIVEQAMADVLTQPGYEPAMRAMRRTMRERFVEARTLIGEHFPAGTRVTDPPGGFVLWVELPAGHDTSALFLEALDAGISIAPGSMFSATGRFGHCFRLGLGGDWGPVQRAALRQLGKMIRTPRDGKAAPASSA